MYALTIHQPWAWAIQEGQKLVENRTWRPPAAVVGQRIAIHASVAKPYRETLDACWENLSEQAVVDLGFVPDALGRESWETVACMRQGRVVATAVVKGCVASKRNLPPEQRRWFSGPFGWQLGDVQVVSSIAIRGQQGLWKLPANFELLPARVPTP